ncbi:MAG TPA: hypothetical protein VFW96_27175 [Thermomicrobiales bacterium]|nr:hypothetical protein [Thermomicrobiales bacterium]
MGGISALGVFSLGLALALLSAAGAWLYLRFGLDVARPWPHLRRWTAPSYVAVGLFELSAGWLTHQRGDGRFWLPVLLGLALVGGAGYALARPR